MLLTPSTIGAIQQDPLRRIFKQASLDLQFAERKSLVDATTGKNLVTFTRASSGTHVGSDGLIKTAVTNLLLRSEEFNDAAWNSVAGARTVTANNQAAPDGATTADTVTADGTSAPHFVSQSAAFSTVSYAYSVFAKAGTNNFLQLRVFSAVGGMFANFNLSTGVLGTVGAGTGTTPTSSIQAYANGWYRCTMVFTPTTATTSSVAAYIVDSAIAGGGVANSLSTSIYLWGAQLEQSSTVGEYIPTTSTINSAPRFDHNPTTGESLGLLVEESRTNLLLYSACDSNWTTAGFGTATYNLGLSALGIFSGVSVGSLGQNWHTLYRSGISLTVSTTYAFTLFYRAGTSGRCRLVFRNNATVTETIIAGVAGNLSVLGTFAGSATVLSQYLCSDGLTYAVTGTFIPNATSADHWFRIGPDSTTSGQTVIALGAQLEAGAFPTSYIPTTTATVTRSADVASISGSNFSSWYRQDEGTVFVNAITNATHNGINTFPRKIAIADGTFSNQIENYYRVLAGYTDAGYRVDVAGVIQAQYDSNDQRNGQDSATGYAVNNFAFVVGGANTNLDTSGTVPTVNQLRLGARIEGSNSLNGTIRRLVYWGQRLPNSTLQAITQ